MKKNLTLCAIIFMACFLSINAQESTRNRRPNRASFTTTNPDVHDPVMARGEDGKYYIFATGMGVATLSSSDMKTWKHEKSALSPIPQKATDSIKGHRGHTRTPDIT